ncbi:MAG: YifB family Mg chelatase-like AAA ATPase [Patescibacteria group bacterium]
MASKVLSAAVVGLDAQVVDVEADLGLGLPKTIIVGLPDTAVQEARERVKSGIRNSGAEWPPGVVTVNLAPASLRKEGSGYDLAMAMAIMLARGEIRNDWPIEHRLFVGELSLDGLVRPVTGVLPIACLARKRKTKELFVPAANAAEASMISGINVFAVKNLAEIIDHVNGRSRMVPYRKKSRSVKALDDQDLDFSYIRGQEQAKRALEIASAGGHNVLMTGPPGSGKTLLARTMTTILPVMSLDESLEVTKIYSVAGRLAKDVPVIRLRPYRAPHHTTSSVALVGGGSWPKPGEISLAHRGVLFLDEFSEFPRQSLESLRQPLEDGVITVSRASGSVQFPARFTLIAARNPCPCGYLNDPHQACMCSAIGVAKYQKKISGPLLDRIDIHIPVPRLEYEKIAEPRRSESSSVVRERVQQARKRQSERFRGTPLVVNAEMTVKHIDQYCCIGSEAQVVLKQAVSQFYLSARVYHRILKVARTIADLEGSKSIEAKHVAEALQFRPQTN